MPFVRALASAPPPWVTAPAQSKQDATPHAEDHARWWGGAAGIDMQGMGRGTDEKRIRIGV